jgi:SAM-dependent methyltransferase
MILNYSEDLESRIKNYYLKVYSEVGLPNINYHVSKRMREDETEMSRCDRLEILLASPLSNYRRHFVVGAGTGGLIVALKRKGATEVLACEPCLEALEIAREKGALVGVKPEYITPYVIETLPYADDSFDSIYCFTVLEHVKNVREAIKEMYRILKPGGFIYIHTPDYRFPYEGHYKVHLPLFLGKKITRLLLKAIGRPTSFLDTIKFTTEKSLTRIFHEEVDIFMRIYGRTPDGCLPEQGDTIKIKTIKACKRFFIMNLSIPDHQEILIRKTAVGRSR